jgi:hypothetical protein
VERLVQRARDLERVLDHERVLDGRHGDAEHVGLLEAVGPQQVRAHLAGDEHSRDRVHHRVLDRRHDVRGARAARGQADADLARRLRVTLGGVPAARLVAHQDMADAAVEQGVVGGDVRAAGKAEYDVDALRLQALHHGIDRPHSFTPLGA